VIQPIKLEKDEDTKKLTLTSEELQKEHQKIMDDK
jgi:hypothetical protein